MFVWLFSKDLLGKKLETTYLPDPFFFFFFFFFFSERRKQLVVASWRKKKKNKRKRENPISEKEER